MTEQQHNYVEKGEQSYREWWDHLLADPEFHRIYEEEAARREQELGKRTVVVYFSVSARKALTDLAARRRRSEAETLRDALLALLWIEETFDHGIEIFLRHPDGRMSQISRREFEPQPKEEY